MEEMLFVYTYIDVLLLVFCRLFFALNFLPIVTESKLPALARGGLTLVLTISAFTILPTTMLNYEPTVLSFFLLMLKECVVGLILSFGIWFFFQVYYFVGQLLSIQGGLAMSNVMDPTSNTQTSLIGRFYYLGFSAVFVMSGGYHWTIKSFVESFIYIPIGEGVIGENVAVTVIEAMTTYMVVAFKIACPILAVLFIITCGLGILARTVPQMNMFVIGMPLKIFVLFIMMVFAMVLVPTFNEMIIEELMNFFFNLIQGMSP